MQKALRVRYAIDHRNAMSGRVRFEANRFMRESIKQKYTGKNLYGYNEESLEAAFHEHYKLKSSELEYTISTLSDWFRNGTGVLGLLTTEGKMILDKCYSVYRDWRKDDPYESDYSWMPSPLATCRVAPVVLIRNGKEVAWYPNVPIAAKATGLLDKDIHANIAMLKRPGMTEYWERDFAFDTNDVAE